MAFAGQLQGRSGASFYAVYDGHGGALAAEFCKEQMHKRLMALGPLLHEAPAAALREAFVQTDLEVSVGVKMLGNLGSDRHFVLASIHAHIPIDSTSSCARWRARSAWTGRRRWSPLCWARSSTSPTVGLCVK